MITKAIYKSSEEDKKEEEVKKTLEQHDNIVTHYKNVIREQVCPDKLYTVSYVLILFYFREEFFLAFQMQEDTESKTHYFPNSKASEYSTDWELNVF